MLSIQQLRWPALAQLLAETRQGTLRSFQPYVAWPATTPGVPKAWTACTRVRSKPAGSWHSDVWGEAGTLVFALKLKHVASAAGFGGVDVMRRAFVRLLRITPSRYRELAEHSIGD